MEYPVDQPAKTPTNKPFLQNIHLSPLLLGLTGLIAALSAWRLLAITVDEPLSGLAWWGGWAGLTLGLWLIWLLVIQISNPLPPKLSSHQWLAVTVGATLFGFGGLLATQPSGLSRLTLEVEADNVWSPQAFEATWSGDGLGRAPLVLAQQQPQPATLEIIATGQGGDVLLIEAVWPNGDPIPLEPDGKAIGWRREKLNWGSYQDHLGWMAEGDDTGALLRWEGLASGPPTLTFAKSPVLGEVVIHWHGQEPRTLDLHSPNVGFRSVTLPFQEPVVWRAKLPLTALGDDINLAYQPDPLNAYPTIYRAIRLRGLPGQTLERHDHQLADALHVEGGWLDLVSEGVQLRASDEYAPPQIFLTGPLAPDSEWRWLLPWLENGLVILYGAVIGFLLMAIIVDRMPSHVVTNFSLMAISLVLMLLLGELGLRLYLPPANRFYVWEPNLHFVFNPKPEFIRGVAGETNVIINGQGFRGQPLTAASDYNILAIGGSTTEALYLDQSEAWPQLVQEGLNENSPNQTVWVGNAGRSGRNTREHVLQVERLLPQHPELDALILLTGINDLGLRLERGERYDPNYRHRPGATQVLMQRAFDAYPQDDPHSRPYYQHSAIWRLVEEAQAASAPPPTTTKIEVQNDDGSFILERQRQRREADIQDDLPDLTTALTEYRQNLQRIIDTAKAHQVRVILITQPTLWRPDLTAAERDLLWFGWGPNFDTFYSLDALIQGIEAYNDVLLDICRERQVECLDLAATLPKDTTVFYDDVHFNESGARQVSKILVDYLGDRPPFK